MLLASAVLCLVPGACHTSEMAMLAMVMIRRVPWVKVVCLLAAGAVVNCAVAVGCALWSPIEWQENSGDSGVRRLRTWGWYTDLAPTEWQSRLAAVKEPAHGWTFGSVEYGDGVELRAATFCEADLDSMMMQCSERWSIASGWPFRSLQCTTVSATIPNPPSTGGWIWGSRAPRWLGPRMMGVGDIRSSGPVEPRPIPLRPIVLGFAINTFLFAALICSLLAGCCALRIGIRRFRGRCPGCGYPRAGLAGVEVVQLSAMATSCPECGRLEIRREGTG